MMSRWRMGEGRSGFTLLELLVVAVIIGIMVGMGWASFADFRENVAARGYATSILAKMREAKNVAQSLTENVTMKVDLDSDVVWLEVDGVQYGTTLAPPTGSRVALLGFEDQTGNDVFTTGTYSIVFTPRNTADGKAPLIGFTTTLHIGVVRNASDNSYASGQPYAGFKTIVVLQTGGRAELFTGGCFSESAVAASWGWPECQSI